MGDTDTVEFNETVLWGVGEWKAYARRLHGELASLRAEKSAMDAEWPGGLEEIESSIKQFRERAERAEAERDAALKDAWKPIPDEVCIRIVSEWYDADESGVELIRRVEAYQNAQR